MRLAFRVRRPLEAAWIACVPQGTQAVLACVERRDDAAPRLHWVERCDWHDGARSLRALRRRRALQRHPRVALIDRQHYRIVPLDAPQLPRPEWPAALRWQLKDLVDFPVEHAAIDVLEVPGDPARRRTPQALAVAAPHDALRPLVAAADAAGTPWQALDIAECALRNLGALVEPPGRAQALLHVGEEGSLLVITAGGELLTSRTLDVGWPMLRDRTEDDPADAPDPDARLRAFDAIGLELQRTLDGFDRLFSHVGLARLLVAPGCGLEDFMSHVRDVSFVPVQALDLRDALDWSQVPELAEPAAQAPYLGAIGAALREA